MQIKIDFKSWFETLKTSQDKAAKQKTIDLAKRVDVKPYVRPSRVYTEKTA